MAPLTDHQRFALDWLLTHSRVTVEGWAAMTDTTAAGASCTLSSLVRRGLAHRVFRDGETFYEATKPRRTP